MTDKNHIPLGKKGSRKMDEFVEMGGVAATTAATVEIEREVTKTFRIPESLGRRLKVHAAQTGQKEKDILVDLIAGYLVENSA
jgi:hypothetical protein